MKIASSSGSPTERRSCCWVPSPQSNSSRSPPARSSIAGSPRRAVGTEPAVPAKKSERSMARPSLERDQLEAHLPGGHGGDPHRVRGRAAALGRRARVEELEAILAALVEGQVRVAEDDRVRVLEPRPHPHQPPRALPG